MGEVRQGSCLAGWTVTYQAWWDFGKWEVTLAGKALASVKAGVSVRTPAGCATLRF